MLFIAEKYLPTEDAKRASGDAFYVLCEHYEEWSEKPFFQGAIDSLRGVACFPAESDTENWHSGGDLYAPYRAEAFRSQANILDFRNCSPAAEVIACNPNKPAALPLFTAISK
mgnify:CR=1 FL=1